MKQANLALARAEQRLSVRLQVYLPPHNFTFIPQAVGCCGRLEVICWGHGCRSLILTVMQYFVGAEKNASSGEIR